jgi:hypothetical protein
VAATSPVAIGDPVDCVDISVDHAKREIKIAVRLTFWSRRMDRREVAQTAAEMVGYMRAGWRNLWFKCYRVVLDLVWSVSNEGEFPDDALDVELVDTLLFFRSQVAVEKVTDQVLSDKPENRHDPIRGGESRRTTWWSGANAYTVLHELGHILGLHDGYDHKTDEALPNHPKDMMASWNGALTPQMITKILRRHGLDLSAIKCPITLDAGPSTFDLGALGRIENMRVHAWACDYDPPTSDPAPERAGGAEFEGRITYVGDARIWGDVAGAIGAHPPGGPVDAPVKGSMGAGDDLWLRHQVPGNPDYSWILGENLRWSVDGLPYIDGPLQLASSRVGPGASTALYPPGPPLMARFKHGAEECPQP